MDNYRIIISGGGTGGHIYPAIAIADELKRRHPNAEILFVGARGRMEMEKVPQAGYRIIGLWITGFQRSLSMKNLAFPFKLIKSLVQARRIVKEFKPHIAIGTGGFASGPLLRMAASQGVPCVLQEQNSFAGVTNKLLASKARRICVAYDGMERFFPASKVIKTGNPVREALREIIVSKEDACKTFGLEIDRPVLLVLGGSLGSKRINELIHDKLAFFASQKVQVIWQCGKGYYETYKEKDSARVKVRAFISEMEQAYAAADLIISRAGAGAVSELSLVGKPVILIPSPHVAEDHQAKNAEALVAKEAALMLRESELDEKFEDVFSGLLHSESAREKLGSNIRSMAMPGATASIVDEIEIVLKNG